MNILFDLSSTQPASISGTDFHGGGEYAKVIFRRLYETLQDGISLECFYDPNRNIEKSILEICSTKQYAIHRCKNNADISRLLHSKRYDVFYSALPYTYSDIVIPPETRFVYTVHGLRTLECPEDKYRFKYKKNSMTAKIKLCFFWLFPALRVWRISYYKGKTINDYNKLFSLTQNQTIITASSHSKYSLLYFFSKLNRFPIKVLYSPLKIYNLNNTIRKDIFDTFSVESGKYILIICGDRPEKGAYRVCKALHKLLSRHSGIPEDIKVIILGITYDKPYRQLTKNSPHFEFYGYVDTEDLEMLYKNAHLFMYPTLNEGFGLPPLEAMKYGTLCACSANSAVTEVCGDAVLYFNPFDETEINIRVLQSFDETIRGEKTLKMVERLQFIKTRQKRDLDTLIREIVP